MSNYRELLQNTKNWNLEYDSQTFGLIENFAQNFLNKIDYFKSDLMKTDYNLKESQNDISHLFCKFQNLSNNHFVENLVKTIEFVNLNEDRKQKVDKPIENFNTQEKVLELFQKSLQNGLTGVNISQIMNSAISNDELNRADTMRNETMSIANFNYMTDKNNRLPYIYGTKQFFSTESIGLIEQVSGGNEVSDDMDFKTEKEKPNEVNDQIKNRSKTMNIESPEKKIPAPPLLITTNTSDSQTAFLNSNDSPNRKPAKTTISMNIQPKIQPTASNLQPPANNLQMPAPNLLPPPPPPPNLTDLLKAAPAKNTAPIVQKEVEKNNQENLTIPIQKTITPIITEKNDSAIPKNDQPLDFAAELRKKQLEIQKKKEAALLNKTKIPVSTSQKPFIAIDKPVTLAENTPPIKFDEKKIENLSLSSSNAIIESVVISKDLPDRTSKDFQSTSKKDFSTINKERLKIKETANLFDDENNKNEDDEEDPLFKNSSKKPLTQLFRPIEVSPKKVIPESFQQEEESPNNIKLVSRPSLRNKDFENMEEKHSLPEITVNENNKLKGLFVDEDEEKSEDLQKIYRQNENDFKKDGGILLRNLRKSHTIKENESINEDKNKQLDHEIMMDKPMVRKKKKNPTLFQDDEEEEKEEKNIGLEKNLDINGQQKQIIHEKQEQVDENEVFIFQKEKMEKEEKIVIPRYSNNQKKLEKLFEDDDQDDDFSIFNKPKKLDSNKKKMFMDDE